MAIAVASTSTGTAASYPAPATITLTAPTGITAGDLLVIVVAGVCWESPAGNPLDNYSANSGKATCTGFTEGYYHSRDGAYNTSRNGAARVNALYKIAVLADQSATEYVVTHSAGATSGASAAMFRITGWTTGNPFAHGLNIYMPYTQDGSATLTYSDGGANAVPAARPSQQVMIMYISTGGYEDGGFTYSNYASTPSATWTELYDQPFDLNSYWGGGFGIAYATTSATTNLTNFSIYKTGDGSDGPETSVLGILQIFTPVSASGTAALHNSTATFFANTGTADGTGSVARINATVTFPSASGTGTDDTVWTVRNKNSTVWTPRS